MLASTITCSRHTSGCGIAPRSRPGRGLRATWTVPAHGTPPPFPLAPAHQGIHQLPQSPQTLDREPLRSRRLATVRPRLRQRHRAAHIPRTHKDQPTTPALNIQNLQTLTRQRVERMRHREKTQRRPG
jgi:hypothetical protein